jgi:SAM-dependent methyltransferase
MSRWETETFHYDKMHVRLQKCLDEVIAAAPSRVLELGCGVGLLRGELKRRLPGVQYFGCDISSAAVAQINDPQVVQADLENGPLPFPGEKFDCVVGSGVFEYVTDLPQLFTALHDRLEPGGLLVVSYYNMHHIYRRLLKGLGLKPHHHPDWKSDLRPEEFAGMLEEKGFQVTYIIPANVCLTRMSGPKTYQHPLVSRIQSRMPLKSLLGHQLIYVARKMDRSSGLRTESRPTRLAL